MKRLVECYIPLDELNKTSKKEAGFIRVPKISNIHPYLARRPTATARTLTLSAVLPEITDKNEFMEALGFTKVNDVPYKILYLVNPDRQLISELIKKYTDKNPEDITILDPMAGGGSIPLESLRLGFRTIAIDYNPVAYLILKAVLEYPARYGRKLYEDVKREVERLLDWAKKELNKYYPAGYIVARGYKCPNINCQGLIPIIHGNKLGKEGPYIEFEIDKDRKTFRVRITSREVKFDKLRCPYCNTPINKDVALKDWVKRHKELLEIALSGDIERAKEKLKDLLETHVLLIKETTQDFMPVNEEDKEALVEAYLDLAQQADKLGEFLLDSQIPKENQVFEPLTRYGIEYWYELFNPRQLLILLKLMKYVRNRAEELIREKGEYGVAIALYLALGVSKSFIVILLIFCTNKLPNPVPCITMLPFAK